jgi:hypothetical protein
VDGIHMQVSRKMLIVLPIRRILEYVLPNPVKTRTISDNMVMVAPLPQWNTRYATYCVDTFGRIHFETSNDFGQQHFPALMSGLR